MTDTGTERQLYFIIRNFLCYLIGTALTWGVFLYFVTMNFPQIFVFGVLESIFLLVVTKQFDKPLDRTIGWLTARLNKHKRLTKVIAKWL